jgi:hypothetical protein
MSKFDKKICALRLRTTGASIAEIAKEFSVSKSTASIWCRDVVLTPDQQKFLKQRMIDAGHSGRLKGALQNKIGKEKRIKDAEVLAVKLFDTHKTDPRFFVGIGLYWGEGTKTDQSATAFINSDPNAVKFMYHWFQDFLGVPSDRFNPYITLTVLHRNREEIIKKFWAKKLGLPLAQIRKVFYIKSTNKKVYENHDLYYGTVALRIRRGSELKYLIRGLLKQINSMST